MKKRGFTLVELIIVMSLVAILSVTIGITGKEQFAKAKDTKAIAVLGGLRTGAEIYLSEHEYKALTTADLKTISQSLNEKGRLLYNTTDSAIMAGGARKTEKSDILFTNLEIKLRIDINNNTDSTGIELSNGKDLNTNDDLPYDTRKNLWSDY